ncbi:MAG TPA: DNA polymerase III subunit delta [Chitinophagaceae bacterium]|nr:DNA polymerase III subunit delta [Chitinophagaceae bacterium]
MSAAEILSEWKMKVFKPLYWLEGEEEFYIDEVMDYAEKKILSETDAAFNLTIFYGRDAVWPEVLNTCRRYPMFAERQVVLLKEAQQMKDIDKLESYIEKPSASTILVVSYKGKTMDGRSRISKLLKKHGEVFVSKKIYDSQLPSWANGYIQSRGFQISPRALSLLVDHIGNDLSRIANEVDKLSINLGDEKNITEDDIEKYIGVSKEYNIFELQHALSKKDLAKAVRIVQYFDANPKAAPIQLVLPSLYNYFTKILVVYQMSDKSEKALRPVFYNNPFLIQQAMDMMMNYSYAEAEQAILLLHHYNLKSIGIKNANTSGGSLMKEMVFKIIKGKPAG